MHGGRQHTLASNENIRLVRRGDLCRLRSLGDRWWHRRGALLRRVVCQLKCRYCSPSTNPSDAKLRSNSPPVSPPCARARTPSASALAPRRVLKGQWLGRGVTLTHSSKGGVALWKWTMGNLSSKGCACHSPCVSLLVSTSQSARTLRRDVSDSDLCGGQTRINGWFKDNKSIVEINFTGTAGGPHAPRSKS